MPTAIDQLNAILNDKQIIPEGELVKWDFIAKYFAIKFKEYLSPDSNHYRCHINPIFTYEFEMNDSKFLGQVKVFSLRDGVMPLMRFFAINPEPPSHCPLLLVESSLSSLIPLCWREKVVLRSAYATEQRKKTNKVFLFCSPDPFSVPIDILDLELQALKVQLHAEDELYIVFSSVKMRGQGEATCDKAWGYKILLRMTEKLSGHKIEILSFREYLQTEISFSRFFIINPLQYYFSDSFLFHDALQRGAIYIRPLPLLEQSLTLRLSLNHGFYFHQNFSSYLGEDYDRIRHTLFHSIQTFAKTGEFLNIHNQLYPQDFMDWGHDVALGLYRGNCHKIE